MSATALTHGDTTRKHLVDWLMRRLKDDIAKIHRKIKTFVYSLQVETLKELSGTCMWTRDPGPCGRAELDELMQRAVGYGVIGGSQDDGSENTMQVNDGVSSQVASIGLSKGLNEICGEKAKKRLKKARQMINKKLKTMSFVVKDDVIDMVKFEGGVTDQAEVERTAQRIWQEDCFTLEIYCTDDGTEGTLAEFMRDWLKSGYSWGASSDHLKTLSRTTRKRALSPKFREAAMKRLRDNAARNYNARDRDHTGDGERSQLIEPLPAGGDNQGSFGEVRFPWGLLS